MAIIERGDIVKILKRNTPVWIQDARSYNKTLKALISGKDYVEELVQIDHHESSKKIEARKKYTFSTKDLSSRLLSNTEAVWTASGGTKLYNIEDEKKKEELVKAVSNVRGGKSLEQWNEAYWMPLYHTDPAGGTILEYNTEKGIDPFPKYVPITQIKEYEENGVNVEWISFEPVTIKDDKGKETQTYRFIDDAYDYKIIRQGEDFVFDDKNTFENPFGQVPFLINSDLKDSESNKRLSPTDCVVELLQEYLRDKSIKTIFKFLQGFPLFWRYVTYCKECTGTGIDAGNNTCKSCHGEKIVGRRDVTDSIDLPIPTEDQPQLDKIADWISPPNEILENYNKGEELLERTAHLTMWGTIIEEDKSNTATGRMIDVQAIIQRLNKYSQAAEIREKKQTDWIANYQDQSKDKNKSIASISLGRNYALLSSTTLLEIYETAKEKGDGSTILDDLFHQYLLSKFKNDPVKLEINTIKSRVEPYIHLTIQQVFDIYSQEEAQKKGLFEKWWNIAIIVNKTTENLIKEYDIWFKNNNKTKIIE